MAGAYSPDQPNQTSQHCFEIESDSKQQEGQTTRHLEEENLGGRERHSRRLRDTQKRNCSLEMDCQTTHQTPWTEPLDGIACCRTVLQLIHAPSGISGNEKTDILAKEGSKGGKQTKSVSTSQTAAHVLSFFPNLTLTQQLYLKWQTIWLQEISQINQSKHCLVVFF